MWAVVEDSILVVELENGWGEVEELGLADAQDSNERDKESDPLLLT